ncbi:hypothetical protein [Oryzomicrobium sp.]|uniref:hypothetical protein n=1 Tax=Oryzomicrobium sp. TaxID=1911578 RepID=UPI0025FB17C3|nr:hypothetical protein [Oryzomicrobium sp.]MCE1243595.1 hypothetical protein [Oryzomicrobium sp.]
MVIVADLALTIPVTARCTDFDFSRENQFLGHDGKRRDDGQNKKLRRKKPHANHGLARISR